MLLEAGDLTAQQKALAGAFQKIYTKSENGSLKLTQENRFAVEFFLSSLSYCAHSAINRVLVDRDLVDSC